MRAIRAGIEERAAMERPFEFTSEGKDDLMEDEIPNVGPAALDVSVPAPYLDHFSIGSPGLLPSKCLRVVVLVW